MGQYHRVVNLDKHEYLDPWSFGDGAKLMEFGNSAGGMMTALAILLGVSNGRGGGDLLLDENDPMKDVIGSWGGDRIAIVGDYYEQGDIEGWDMNDNPWSDGDWTDISDPVRYLIEQDGLFKFVIHEHGTVERIEH